MNLKEKAQRLKTDIPAIFMALQHPQTPWYAKIVAALTLGYALSPIDFVPDFIPLFGYLDDLILLPLLIAWVIKLIPKDVFAECREKSQDLWKNGKPKKWYYAIPIVCIWLLLFYWIVKAVVGW